MDNKVLDIVKNVCDKTIGSELSSVKTLTNEEYISKRNKELAESLNKLREEGKYPIKEDETLSECIDILTGKWCYSVDKKPLCVDETKDWKSQLTDEDYDVLSSHNISRDEIDKWVGKFGIADRDDDILIIKTSQASWLQMCGREWHYNLKTKVFELVAMS